MPPRPKLVLAALWALNFTTSAQFLIVAPILPRISEQLGVPEAWLGSLVTAYAVAFGITALLAGPISDYIGRRKVLLFGAVGMAAALLLHGVALSYASFLSARILAGLMSGTLSGASVAYIGDAFPYNRRGWANGWIASSMAAGQIIGIPIGAVLATATVQTPFLALGVVCTLAAALIYRFVPQPPVERSAVLSARSSFRAYRAQLAVPHLRAAVAAYILMFFSVGSFITYLPVWLEARFEVGGAEVASLFLVGGLSNLVVGPIAGSLSDRIGRKPLVVLGSFALGVLMAASPWIVPRFEVAYVLFFTIMVFVALRMAPQQALVSSLVPASQRGTLLSLCLSFGQGGFAVGAALSGPIYTSAIGFEGCAALAGASAIAMSGVMLIAVPEPEAEPDPAKATT